MLCPGPGERAETGVEEVPETEFLFADCPEDRRDSNTGPTAVRMKLGINSFTAQKFHCKFFGFFFLGGGYCCLYYLFFKLPILDLKLKF